MQSNDIWTLGVFLWLLVGVMFAGIYLAYVVCNGTLKMEDLLRRDTIHHAICFALVFLWPFCIIGLIGGKIGSLAGKRSAAKKQAQKDEEDRKRWARESIAQSVVDGLARDMEL